MLLNLCTRPVKHTDTLARLVSCTHQPYGLAHQLMHNHVRQPGPRDTIRILLNTTLTNHTPRKRMITFCTMSSRFSSPVYNTQQISRPPFPSARPFYRGSPNERVFHQNQRYKRGCLRRGVGAVSPPVTMSTKTRMNVWSYCISKILWKKC